MSNFLCWLQVVIDPLLWPQADYFTGPLIQIYILQPERSGASSLVAAGEPPPPPPPLTPHPHTYGIGAKHVKYARILLTECKLVLRT